MKAHHLRWLTLLVIVNVLALNPTKNFSAEWEWRNGQWTFTNTYSKTAQYAARPDEATVDSVIVEWQQPELDRLGNRCIVRGKLMIPADNTGRVRTVEWFQGVTIYLAQLPESKPNWTKGLSKGDSIYATTVVDASGVFLADLDLSKTEYDRSLPQLFQFGLALAEHSTTESGKELVVWKSAQPAIAGSVTMLEIPKAPELPKELELINAARDWPFKNPDSTSLIRAVNALQPLGKDEALRTLEEFLKINRDEHAFDSDEIVFWVIRVLFEPIQMGQKIPRPMIAVHLDDRQRPNGATWPLNPIVVIDDIPFMLGHRIGMGGRPENPRSHILWARRFGVIRDAPLKPATDPRRTAEALCNCQRFEALDQWSRGRAREQIRDHAGAMVTNSIRPANERWDREDTNLEDPREFRWDPDREAFLPVKQP